MVTSRVIHFQSEGVPCEGDLYLPDGFDDSRRYPALVLGHGFTIARTSLVEEGRLFAEAGYVALAIDYRRFGGSGGEPRGHVDPIDEAEDFRSAIDWLEMQPGVDRDNIGIWGCSFGGGIVTHAAAYDMRVKACVAQTPILDGDYWIRSLNREADYLLTRKYLTDYRRARAAGETEERYTVPNSVRDDGFNPMPADPVMIEDTMGWYKETGKPLIDGVAQVTIRTFERIMQFDAVPAAARISPRAYCIVQFTGYDIYHPNVLIQQAYRLAGEPKQLISIPIDQLDGYKPFGRAPAIAAAVGFFDRFLK